MGVEVKEGSAPFQESQCQVIFSVGDSGHCCGMVPTHVILKRMLVLLQVLGVPQPSDWDGLESLPEYDKIRGWRSGYPTKSVLREVRSSVHKV
jgi:hypothetical protein